MDAVRSGTILNLDERLRWLALLAGISMVISVVATTQVPRGTGIASADVAFVASPTGELGISPVGTFLNGVALVPSSDAFGRLAVTNQTGKRLAVLVRALPESRDLDDLLHVRIEAQGEPLFDGTLGALRRGATVEIEPAVTEPLEFRAWLPASLEEGYEGRVVSVSFDLGSTPADA